MSKSSLITCAQTILLLRGPGPGLARFFGPVSLRPIIYRTTQKESVGSRPGDFCVERPCPHRTLWRRRAHQHLQLRPHACRETTCPDEDDTSGVVKAVAAALGAV